MLAYEFSEKALDLALSKGIRPISVEYSTDGNFSFHILGVLKKKTRKRSSLRGRLADSKGRAFESAVEKTFEAPEMKTSRRKYFYLDNGRIAERDTGTALTDVDVLTIDEGKREAVLVECKSAKKQLSRSQLLRTVKNFERIAYYLQTEKNLNASTVIIGNLNELDMIDAKRRSGIPMTFFTPREFYLRYKEKLKGEPQWLFT